MLSSCNAHDHYNKIKAAAAAAGCKEPTIFIQKTLQTLIKKVGLPRKKVAFNSFKIKQIKALYYLHAHNKLKFVYQEAHRFEIIESYSTQ